VIANLTVSDPADDPRATRVVEAARARGVEIVALSLDGHGGPTKAPAGWRELRGVGRLVRTVLATFRLLLRGRHIRPSIVHAHDLETLPAGWLLAMRHRARLVYDAHELYTGFDVAPPRFWLAVASRAEGLIARRAGAVITVSSPIAERLEKIHSLPTRPTVLLNCPPLEDVEIVEHPQLRGIYQAAAGPGRQLEDLPDVPGVAMHARVLGATAGPHHVTMLDPVLPEHIVSALAPFDIGLVIDRPETDNARFALPNKLFEYMMAGLAVVVPNVPAMARLVETEGIGRTYEPGRLGQVLSELAADRPAVEEMRRRARRAAVERYNAEAQRPVLYEAWGL
jgi:glycosyltransferase involved in cell wall biosynthesis